ncbi:MAG: radical SAM protein [Acidobacteria bacterium]|nr:MAG: radical SAM protein [Acidobacteriota bacterium]
MGGAITIGEWIFSAKPHSTAISPDRTTVWSFDLEGRPISWFEGELTYKRSLASAVHARSRRGGTRRRWIVPPEEARALFARILEGVARAPRAELPRRLSERIDLILSWTPDRLLAEKERFDRAYEPITILPPDQYLSIVVQATRGCTWNRCTFCSFYQDRPFAVRTPEEFARHLDAVRDLLGRGAALRRGLFLADGNALVLARSRLLPLVRAARDAFPGRPIAGFVDVFSGERKPEEEWRELRDEGLARAAIGIETGHDPLLAWLDKPGSAGEALRFTETLARAGIGLSLIFMCGVGGDRFAGAHLRDSLALIERLPLRPGDIVYLSPFVEHPGSEYARRARAEGIRPLPPAEIEAQMSALREGVRRRHPQVRVAPYDIREFVY